MFENDSFCYDSKRTKQHLIFSKEFGNYHTTNIKFLQQIDMILKKDLNEEAKSIYTECYFGRNLGINFDKVVQRVAESRGEKTPASVDLVFVIRKSGSEEFFTLLVESKMNGKRSTHTEATDSKIDKKIEESKLFLGDTPPFYSKSVVLYLDFVDGQNDIRSIESSKQDVGSDKIITHPAKLAASLFSSVGNSAENK